MALITTPSARIVIGCAIKVHRALGPGLFESVYQVVESELIVEVKAVETIAPVHCCQVLTYMRLAGLRKGLLINFNVSLLKNGIKSFVI